MKPVQTIAIFLFTLAGSASVLADEAVASPFETFSVRTVTVSYADLDLAVPADAATLLDRIEKSATKVCRRIESGTGIERLNGRRECFRDSYSRGISAINARVDLDIEAVAARAARTRSVVAAD